MPSFHTALSFGLATATVFLTGNVFVIGIAFFLAILVGESRVEGKIHSLLEVIFGGLLGLILTAFIFQLFIM